ncbi:succinylglutamate desuccinylase/aspartoacylase family protein [bacterium]|nr:succinylglutamate desuccinylase/aspartoacylase family protein [bacterium]
MNTPFSIGGHEIAPGRMEQIQLPAARLPIHTMLELPVTVVNGSGDGTRLWLSATLHGDELNGMEIIRRVIERLDPASMKGLLIAVPIVNVFGFINQSRYLPDRRDLNRSFPGSRRGSLAGQLAWLFMSEVVAHCTHGIDLHTAAPPRTNLPQVRTDLSLPENRRLAEAFRAPIFVHGAGPAGTLRGAAGRRGKSVILYEAGEPLRFNDEAIEIGVAGVLRAMAALDMIEAQPPAPRGREAGRTKWIRAPQSGVIYLEAKLGDVVEHRERIARITDPLGGSGVDVRAPMSGIVIGHTNHPLVHRGDGIVHVAERKEPGAPVSP